MKFNNVKNGSVFDIALSKQTSKSRMKAVANTRFGWINAIFEGIMDQGNESESTAFFVSSGKAIDVCEYLSDMIDYLTYFML